MTKSTKLLTLTLAVLLCLCCVALVACDNRFADKPTYDIVVEQSEHGTAYVASRGRAVTKAAVGDMLFVTVRPDTGYELADIEINGSAATDVRFTMPDGNVTIKVTFRAVGGNITVNQSVGGQIYVSKTSAVYGEIIAVTVTPDDGYIMRERSLVANFTEIYKGRIDKQTSFDFVMPDTDVVISATFDKLPDYDLAISTFQEYKDFADSVNKGNKYLGKKIVLTADIGSPDNPVKTRIGNSATNYFAGTFDGQGHTVYLQLNATNSVGMFGYVGGATICNVVVAGSVMRTGDGGGSGGIVGAVLYNDGNITTIQNCTNNATVTAGNTSANKACNDAGGIVGVTTGNLVVTDCTNNGIIVAESNRAGGIVGRVNQQNNANVLAVNVERVRNTGTVTAKTTTSTAQGSIVGQIASATTNIFISTYNAGDDIIGANYNKGKTEIVDGLSEPDQGDEEERKQ